VGHLPTSNFHADKRGASHKVCRFNAFMTAIRASISGPSRSATSNSTSIATCQSAESCSAFGSAVI
jgi:hypothetical protein